MSSREAQSVQEILPHEEAHSSSKRAFEAAAADFDGLAGIEGAWHHLDNWRFDPGGRNYQCYHQNKEAKEEAASKLAETHQALAAAFAALPEASQRRLVERPVITFGSQSSESNGSAPAGFEFNLPEIVTGFEAQLRLYRQYDRQWRQAVRAGRAEMDAATYGHDCWQAEALYLDSVSLAADFLLGGKQRIYSDELEKPEVQLTLARLAQMEELSKIYLEALGNGDETTRLALHFWMRRVNARFLSVCETAEVATEMSQQRIDWWIQRQYPHESVLIPIGRTMISKKNLKHIEHNKYTDYY